MVEKLKIVYGDPNVDHHIERIDMKRPNAKSRGSGLEMARDKDKDLQDFDKLRENLCNGELEAIEALRTL